MPEALVRFTAAGHIRFGIGGDSDGDLSEDTNNEYLPVIVVPIAQASTYYRKFFVENIDTVPFYRWKIVVRSNRDEISVQIAHDNDPQSRIYNSQLPPAVPADRWKSEVKGSDVGRPLLEPNRPLTFWLKISATPQAERHNSYTITLSFEGYS